MKQIPATPKDYIEEVIVLLDDNRVALEYGFGTFSVNDLQYRRDVNYDDIVAEATKTMHCIGFSHWYVMPGDSHENASPVWRWEASYRVDQRYRVGRNGKLKRL